MQVQLTRADLVVVGSASGPAGELSADYERRLSRYVRLRVHELKGEPLQRGQEHVRATEGERIAAKLASLGEPRVVVLDVEGEVLSTERFAGLVLTMPQVAIVVGGAYGIDDAVTRAADARVSFGRATLPHQLARVIAVEQLYRAFRIARGEPYHH